MPSDSALVAYLLELPVVKDQRRKGKRKKRKKKKKLNRNKISDIQMHEVKI